MNLSKIRILNGNHIKILACVLMLIDHIGYLFYPQLMVLRYIGRVSMPLFAFMIAEGCRYTKNKVKHFALMFILGVACQVVYYFFDDGSLYMSILITFSLSVLVVYAMQYAKKCLFGSQVKVFDKVVAVLLFAAVVFAVYAVNQIKSINGREFTIDYGFWGCMLPAFAALLDFRGIALPEKLSFLDNHYLKLIPFAVGIILMALEQTTLNEWYGLIALVPLLLYNGTRGKVNLKYFFYVFYPLHLVLLEGIYMLML
jgi:hypothetical protein